MNRPNISSNIMSRMRVFESTDSCNSTVDNSQDSTKSIRATDRYTFSSISDREIIRTIQPTMMMSSPPPPGVQTDADGLILPKKLINPCLENTDRKQLHRELKFNNKIGKSVLNQKSELQRAYEKQRERQQMQQQPPDHSPTASLKGELSRVIMERAQKHERERNDGDDVEDKQYVNPEYLNVRAKLRTGQRGELK